MEKKLYLVLDTETTVPLCCRDIAGSDEEKRKKLSIMRPLCYDVSWVLCDRFGNIVKERSYVVNEIYYNTPMMDLAFYADRRPLYEDRIEKGEIIPLPWETIMKYLQHDMLEARAVGGYNASFDFFKAIPFTDIYVSKLKTSKEVFDEWYTRQKELMRKIADEPAPSKGCPDPAYDPDHFKFRGNTYALFDIWGMACEHLINNNTYKHYCLINKMMTNSGEYFKTSAEAVYRYVTRDWDFDEAHTAIDDSRIEAMILGKITARHSPKGVVAFPFRYLGTVDEFCPSCPRLAKKHIQSAIEIMENYLASYKGADGYRTKIQNKIDLMYLLLDNAEEA